MLELIQPILIIGLSAIAIKLYLDNRKYKRYEIEDIEYPKITTWDQDLSDQIEYAYNVKVYGKDTWDEISLLRKNVEDLKRNKHKYFDPHGETELNIIRGGGYQDTLENSVNAARKHKPSNTYNTTNTDYNVMIEYAERYIADLLTRSRLDL